MKFNDFLYLYRLIMFLDVLNLLVTGVFFFLRIAEPFPACVVVGHCRHAKAECSDGDENCI